MSYKNKRRRKEDREEIYQTEEPSPQQSCMPDSDNDTDSESKSDDSSILTTTTVQTQRVRYFEPQQLIAEKVGDEANQEFDGLLHGRVWVFYDYLTSE